MRLRSPIHAMVVLGLSLVAVVELVPKLSAEVGPIDRHALVSRHNIVLTAYHGTRPLSVGNGEFAFNMDVTGLQTFAPFNTMSHWGWHSGSPPAGTKVEDYQEQMRETHGRMVPYPLPDPKHDAISNWLASSPHRINLGRVGLAMTRKDGSPATEADLTNITQELDLWRGVVTSRFDLEGVSVRVETACHPTQDAIAARVESALCAEGRLAVFLASPGNNPLQFANFVGDWTRPGRLEPLASTERALANFKRTIDEHVSYVSLAWETDAGLRKRDMEIPPLRILSARYGVGESWVDVKAKVAAGVRESRVVVHAGNELVGEDPAPKVRKSLRVEYEVGSSKRTAEVLEGQDLFLDAAPERDRVTLAPAHAAKTIAFVCAFSPTPITAVSSVDAAFRACEEHWADYWNRGGAIDLSESSDPRWRELERRIVLSQYQMAVHEAGSLPPQESGLVNNGWFGRFHMEMVWWHSTHWALWDRWPELNKSLGIYDRLLAGARKRAESQGYRGARWPKCVGPDGREWPHEIHAFLIWQQPHPIFFAELDYLAHPTRETLERWKEIVDATADFMATYAAVDEKGRYSLGPPIHLVSENSPPYTTRNPAFELGYWRFGLRVAQEWRTRMGEERRADWDKVLAGLAPLPVQDGVYVLHEDVTEMWTTWNFEHPALTGTYGLLPGDGADRTTMARTLTKIGETWNFDRTWGWDFPMLAMAAARVGEPKKAVDFLLHPAGGFQFDECGLATGGPFPYFPSNGGLLYATAMMAAGWDGAEKKNAPGFPEGWVVKWEGLKRAP